MQRRPTVGLYFGDFGVSLLYQNVTNSNVFEALTITRRMLSAEMCNPLSTEKMVLTWSPEKIIEIDDILTQVNRNRSVSTTHDRVIEEYVAWKSFYQKRMDIPRTRTPSAMQRRPTVGPGSQWVPFRERLPGTISKLGKGTALQRWQTWGVEGRCNRWEGGHLRLAGRKASGGSCYGVLGYFGDFGVSSAYTVEWRYTW